MVVTSSPYQQSEFEEMGGARSIPPFGEHASSKERVTTRFRIFVNRVAQVMFVSEDKRGLMDTAPLLFWIAVIASFIELASDGTGHTASASSHRAGAFNLDPSDSSALVTFIFRDSSGSCVKCTDYELEAQYADQALPYWMYVCASGCCAGGMATAAYLRDSEQSGELGLDP
nr:hypothetical protein Iba_chr08eCG2290 [Ipomoea batatas]